MAIERKPKESDPKSEKPCLRSSEMSTNSASRKEKLADKPKLKIKKDVNHTVVKKRRNDDFWINIGVVFLISFCLIILGWDVLLKVV